MNDGNLEFFYFLLVGVSILDLLYLYAVSRKYEYHGWGKQVDRIASAIPANGVASQPTPVSTHELTNSVDSLHSGSEVSDASPDKDKDT